MPKSIKAGSILDMFKSIDEFFKWLTDDAGMKVSDKKLIKDEEDEDVNIGEQYTVSTDEGKIRVKVLAVKPPFKRSGKVDLYLVSDSNDKKKLKNIDYKEVPGEVESFLIECFGDDIFEEVEDEEDTKNTEEESTEDNLESEDTENTDNTEESESDNIAESTKIQIKCSRDINDKSSIILNSVSFKCDPVFANNIICEVMESDEFLDNLPAIDEVCYEIVPTDVDIEIAEIDGEDYIEPIVEAWMFDIYRSQYIARLRLELKRIQLGISATVNNSALCMLNYQIDTITAMLGNSLHNEYKVMDIIKSIDYNSVVDNIHQLNTEIILEEYAQCLDVYYPNLPHEVQSLVDNWLLSIRYEPRY